MHWKSSQIPAVRAKIRAEKLLSSSREKRCLSLGGTSTLSQMRWPHCSWWSSCLDDPLTLTTRRKETWGLIPQWERIQGIWSWMGIPSWQPVVCAWQIFCTILLMLCCCAGEQTVQDRTETSFLPHRDFGWETNTQNYPDIRDRSHTFLREMYFRIVRNNSPFWSRNSGLTQLRFCGQSCAESQ